MNRKLSGRKRAWGFAGGQSAAELGMVMPFVVLLLLAIVDFARFFYVTVALNGAARAGVQFGAQSLTTAADTSGMTAAADADWNNSNLTMTVTPSLCTCVSGSNVSACPSSYCSDDAEASFVQVQTQVTVANLISYLKIPSATMSLLSLSNSGSLTGNAIMQVQQ